MPRPERTGTVEGADRDDVLEAGGLQLDEELLHAARLQLEHAGGVPGLEKLVGGFVIVPEGRDVEGRVLPRPDHLDRVVDDGQVLEPEKVEFDQADFFHVLHGVLGRDGAVLRVLVDGAEFLERRRRDHDPGGMGGCVAGQPFETEGGVEELPDARIGAGQLVEPRLLGYRLPERDPEHLGNELGDPVHVAVGEIEGPPHVPDDAAGRHGAEGDDLADLVPAVLLGNILDHFLAPVLAEVDVDIGH